jgi:hypothetical protein
MIRVLRLVVTALLLAVELLLLAWSAHQIDLRALLVGVHHPRDTSTMERYLFAGVMRPISTRSYNSF